MLTRRRFLGLLAAAVAISPAQVLAAGVSDSRSIWLQRGNEQVQLAYLQDGQFQLDAWTQFSWLLRDVEASQQIDIDPKLLDVLHGVQEHAREHGYDEPIEILSGYRTKRTNRRAAGARHSFHLVGQAVDFRLPGLSARTLGRVVERLAAGGAGVYGGRDFVHVDTGWSRSWRG